MDKGETDKILETLYRVVEEYAKYNGAREVHRSWLDNMLKQGRAVDQARMHWSMLPKLDKMLDANIAHDVVIDFLVWALGHPHDNPSREED